MTGGAREARVPAPSSLIGWTLSATLSVAQTSSRSQLLLWPWNTPAGHRRTRILVNQKVEVPIKSLDDGMDALYTVLNIMRSKM